MAQIERWRQA
ncbi:Protein of unknown function [Escherichia coli D6-117.29]|nr:Protein of unknown function [Escherichia coli D6-113.11]CDP74431.1 Protein of unknown function [Escherichia coli]CDP76408.1 Protein of unknown function [Escherichia coli D6-117.29]SPO67558.1 protein of unknown function [Pseudomonas sp. JV241A]CDP64758.1 Protein of unknown function [Escherichia coli D6-113.11]